MQSFSESLNSPYPYERVEEILAYKAFKIVGESNESYWHVEFHMIARWNMVEIVFGTKRFNSSALNVTRRMTVGNPLRLFATIKQILNTEFAHIDYIRFSAFDGDKAKEVVYDRLAALIAASRGWKIDKMYSDGDILWTIGKTARDHV